MSYNTEKNEKLVDRAWKAIVAYQITSISKACLNFTITTDQSAKLHYVDVREKHDDQCGGDPMISPKIVSLRIDPSTKRIWLDNFLNGEWELLK